MSQTARPCADQHPRPEVSQAHCRLCWLYLHAPEYRSLWGGQPADLPSPGARALPCFLLGAVLDRRGCDCPARWLRACDLHGTTTIDNCKTCEDYQEGG